MIVKSELEMCNLYYADPLIMPTRGDRSQLSAVLTAKTSA
jgi:hypothetical protein